MSDATETTAANPVPWFSLAALAAVAFVAFAPRFIEGTPTTCAAVSVRLVRAEFAIHPEAALMPDYVRAVAAQRMLQQSQLAVSPWYSCSAMYWTLFVNPPDADR